MMKPDDFADELEVILQHVDLSGVVRGAQYNSRCAYLYIAWQPGVEPLKRVFQCKALTADMKRLFGCVVAGVDGDDPWRIYARWDSDFLEVQP